MVYLQVGPEVPGQVAGEVVESAVVEPWPAFLQVVDQQLADRCAGHAVTVDQLRAGELTHDLVEETQGHRGVGRHIPQVSQPGVEEGAAGLGTDQLP